MSREWAERVTDTILENTQLMQEIVREALDEMDSLRSTNADLRDGCQRSLVLYDMMRFWGFEHERAIDRMYVDAAEFYSA